MTARGVLIAAVVAALAVQAAASLLSVGELQVCDNAAGVAGSEGSLSCDDKFVLALTVQNGQNGTEAVQTYMVDTMIGDDGFTYEVQEDVTITLSKTPVRLDYPLVYRREVNNGPVEVLRTSNGDGPFSIINPCPGDGDGACGHVVDDDGNKIPYSGGFCCQCSIGQLLGVEGNTNTRSSLNCDLFGDVKEAFTAHCLRMDWLWYSLYEPQSPRVVFEIDINIESCTGSGSARNCTTHTLTLSPSTTSACHHGTRQDGSCQVYANLEGDFASFVAPLELGSKLLARPSVCEAMWEPECAAKVQEPETYWMLIDDHQTTDGDECNKVGVSYEAFALQSSACQRTFRSCLGNQLRDFYNEDRELELRGETGRYFLKNYRDNMHVQTQGVGRFSLQFETGWYQQSVLTLEVAADFVSYLINTSPGEIRSAVLGDFETNSASGRLDVHVINLGDLKAKFTVAVECSEGVMPVQARQIDLEAAPAAQSERELTYQVFATVAGDHVCSVQLLDGRGRTTDSTVVQFTSTEEESDRGTQGGDAIDGTGGDPPAAQVVYAPPTCDVLCSGPLDLICLLDNGCGTLQTIVLVLLGTVCLYGYCAKKHPETCCLPCRVLSCGLCTCGEKPDRDAGTPVVMGHVMSPMQQGPSHRHKSAHSGPDATRAALAAMARRYAHSDEARNGVRAAEPAQRGHGGAALNEEPPTVVDKKKHHKRHKKHRRKHHRHKRDGAGGGRGAAQPRRVSWK